MSRMVTRWAETFMSGRRSHPRNTNSCAGNAQSHIGVSPGPAPGFGIEPRRLPPLELHEGEALFVNWAPRDDEVHVQLRCPGRTGRYTARATYPTDLFRRPPTAATADWIRQELLDEFRVAKQARSTNRRPKRPRW